MNRQSVLQRSNGVAAAREKGPIWCDAGRGASSAITTAIATPTGQVSCFAVGVAGLTGTCELDDGTCRHTQVVSHLQDESCLAPLLAAQHVCCWACRQQLEACRFWQQARPAGVAAVARPADSLRSRASQAQPPNGRPFSGAKRAVAQTTAFTIRWVAGVTGTAARGK
jgi:hypothetical protein